MRAASDEISPAGEANLGFRIKERRIIRGNQQVALVGEHEAAAHHPTSNRADNRLLDLDADPGNRAPQIVRDVVEVGAHCETLIAGCGQHRYAVIACAEFGAKRRQVRPPPRR